MKIKISESTITKIRKAEYGEKILSLLISLCNSQNTENTAYSRGIIHGYLLMLTTIEGISGEDALEILEQLER